jgi:hypothetical protein
VAHQRLADRLAVAVQHLEEALGQAGVVAERLVEALGAPAHQRVA